MLMDGGGVGACGYGTGEELPLFSTWEMAPRLLISSSPHLCSVLCALNSMEARGASIACAVHAHTPMPL